MTIEDLEKMRSQRASGITPFQDFLDQKEDELGELDEKTVTLLREAWNLAVKGTCLTCFYYDGDIRLAEEDMTVTDDSKS